MGKFPLDKILTSLCFNENEAVVETKSYRGREF